MIAEERKMMSLQDAADAIKAMGRGHATRDVHDLSLLWAEDRLCVDVGAGIKPLSHGAEADLRFLTGLDGRVLQGFADDTDLFRQMIQHRLSKVNQGVVLSFDNQDVLSIRKEPPVGPSSVLSVAGEFAELDRVERVARVRQSLEIRFVSQEALEPPRRRGDLSHAGVLVEINGSVRVSPYVVRMVCVNGMMRTITPEVVVAGRELESVRKSFRRALDDSKQLCRDFIALDEQQVPNPTALLTNQFRHHGVAPRYQVAVMEQLPSLPDNPTAYDVVNLVTAVGREHRRLQWAAPQLVKSLADNRCTHCGTLLR